MINIKVMMSATAEDQDESYHMPEGTNDHHEAADQPTAETNFRRSIMHCHKPLRLGQTFENFIVRVRAVARRNRSG